MSFIPEFAKRQPFLAGGMYAMPAVAAGAGLFQYSRDRELYPQMEDRERISRSGFVASEAAAGAVLVGIGAQAAWPYRSEIAAAGKTIGRKAGAGIGAVYTSSAARSEALRQTLRASGRSSFASSVHAYGSNALLMVSGGAALGAAIGAAYDDPKKGAVIGAGTGLAVKVALGTGRLWGKAGRIPGARTAVLAAASTALYMGVRSVMPAEVAGTAYAAPNESGGYDYSEVPVEIKSRMNRIGATGDIALGLHNQRHGR